jgi:hypothetical protein
MRTCRELAVIRVPTEEEEKPCASAKFELSAIGENRYKPEALPFDPSFGQRIKRQGPRGENAVEDRKADKFEGSSEL